MSQIRNTIKKEHRDIFLSNDLYKKYKEQTVKDKTKYCRKTKHKNSLEY